MCYLFTGEFCGRLNVGLNLEVSSYYIFHGSIWLCQLGIWLVLSMDLEDNFPFMVQVYIFSWNICSLSLQFRKLLCLRASFSPAQNACEKGLTQFNTNLKPAKLVGWLTGAWHVFPSIEWKLPLAYVRLILVHMESKKKEKKRWENVQLHLPKLLIAFEAVYLCGSTFSPSLYFFLIKSKLKV